MICARRAACTARGVLIAALALAAGAPAASGQEAGSVSGTVEVLRKRFLGGPRPLDDRSGVIVYLSGFRDPPPDRVAELDQRNESFSPRLLPIVAGQKVLFPNRDPIYHNVFSVSPVQSFDLGQYKASDLPREVAFDRPGLVPVFCNIHPHMIAYVVVLENRAYAVTDEDGRFALEGVPPGDHVLHAWTPGAQRVSRPVEIRPGEEIAIQLELLRGGIPPHKRKDGSDYPPPGSEVER